MTDVVLWEAGGKYIPVALHASPYNDYVELFIVEKIVLTDNGGSGFKRIKLIDRKVRFDDNGAIAARAGSIVVGFVPVDTPIGLTGKVMIYGYVAENESSRYQTPYGDVVIRNVKAVDCPCINYSSKDPGKDFTDCIINYYSDLLNNGVDIDGVDKEYIPWEELERTICVLLFVSIREKLTGMRS